MFKTAIPLSLTLLSLTSISRLAAQETLNPAPDDSRPQIYFPAFPPPPLDPNAFQINSGTELVLLDVSVKNAHGGFVSNLSKENFSVREDGKTQQISAFAAQDTPVTVGLVVDNSGSMGPKRPAVVTAALTFVHESLPQDEVFVVNFNDKVTLGLPPETPFTDDVTLLRQALLNNPTTGRTALYDAIAKALQQLEKGKRDKKTLIVISDGGDNISQLHLNEILRMVEESRATIYTIGIFDDDDKDQNPGVMKKLAAITGGEAYFPATLDPLVDVCKKIAKDIRARYTVGYSPENRNYDNALRKIQVVASGDGGAKMIVRTRTSYIARKSRPVTSEVRK